MSIGLLHDPSSASRSSAHPSSEMCINLPTKLTNTPNKPHEERTTTTVISTMRTVLTVEVFLLRQGRKVGDTDVQRNGCACLTRVQQDRSITT